jgi:hypothetical protein
VSALAGSAAPPRRLTGWRGWALAALAMVCAFVILGLLAEAFAPAPSGPSESSLATSSGGVAAWAELLARSGHPVAQLRRPLASVPIESSETLVMLGAGSLSAADGRHVAQFVRAGGRLVIGGGDPEAVLADLIADPPAFESSGPTVTVPASDAPEVRGVGTVVGDGDGSWKPSRSDEVLLAGGSGRPVLLARDLGRGRIEMLADPSVLENARLGSAGNALLALQLAGGAHRLVAFDETLHGFGEATGLAAIPARWWVMFAGLALAAGAWALTRGRRIGPPERRLATAAPPRVDYVRALAGALVRTREHDELAQLARRAQNDERET